MVVKNKPSRDGSILNSIDRLSDNLPGDILKVLQSSINPRKGKIGELMTLMEIKGEYDMIIPLGQPIDFIGVSKDSIDFIEVKTGSSRLTDHERRIKELVEEGKVAFRCIRYQIESSDAGIGITTES
jgi:predicted Holliday junction resolvase-like endonuclease